MFIPNNNQVNGSVSRYIHSSKMGFETEKSENLQLLISYEKYGSNDGKFKMGNTRVTNTLYFYFVLFISEYFFYRNS